MKKFNKRGIFIILIIFLIFIFLIFNYKKMEMKTDNIKIENNIIYLNSLTLEQKIAQMFIVRANEKNLKLAEFNIGGIYVGGLENKKEYKEIISNYQDKSKITLLVSTDLEGYWNPFVNFAQFPNLDEIKNNREAYNLGKEHGKILVELGFNINFAPVAEIEDNVWKHRAFTGSSDEISEKVNSYVSGLQEKGIMATLKHYPGGSLNIKDPHKYSVKAEITKEQLEIFNSVLENVSAVMVGHAIVYGAIDSKGKPSSVSKEVIQDLREKFSGLIITDDIGMKSLMNKYLFNEKQLFIDLVKAGNDIIIGTSLFEFFPEYNLKKRIGYIKEAVRTGEISEKRIDDSVARILKAKGYNLV